MWLGFVAFFAGMAVLSVVVTLCRGIPLDPVGVVATLVLLAVLGVLYTAYRRAG